MTDLIINTSLSENKHKNKHVRGKYTHINVKSRRFNMTSGAALAS